MFLGTLVIGSFLATSIAVAQNEPQQRPDGHQAGEQQRQGQPNAGQTGQQPQNRQPQQQQYHQQQQPQQQNRQPQPNHQQQQPQQQLNRQPQPNHQQQQPQQYRQPQQSGAQQQNRQQQSNRGQQQYRPENRPQRWGRPPANRPTYNFRSNGRDSLRRYYASRFGAIDRARRPIFRIGGYLPYEDLGFFSPVPPGVWGSLPPIPYGYEAAYWDGYVVIYDPNTGYILYVTDLL
jgi:hypothetical protein